MPFNGWTTPWWSNPWMPVLALAATLLPGSTVRSPMRPATGAVIRDILHRVADRFPLRVLVWPVLVQGQGAAEQVAAAVRGFSALRPDGPVPRPDLVIWPETAVPYMLEYEPELAPMIAGLYLLTNTGRIEPDKAVAWIKARDWSWHQSGDDDGDAQNFIRHLMTARIRYDAQGIGRESTVGRMVEMALDDSHHAHADVVAGLRSSGLKVDGGMLWIANKSPAISKIMDNTSWTTWHRTLMDFPGADTFDGKAVYFAAGMTSKVRRVPLAGLIQTAIAEMPQDVEEPW